MITARQIKLSAVAIAAVLLAGCWPFPDDVHTVIVHRADATIVARNVGRSNLSNNEKQLFTNALTRAEDYTLTRAERDHAQRVVYERPVSQIISFEAALEKKEAEKQADAAAASTAREAADAAQKARLRSALHFTFVAVRPDGDNARAVIDVTNVSFEAIDAFGARVALALPNSYTSGMSHVFGSEGNDPTSNFRMDTVLGPGNTIRLETDAEYVSNRADLMNPKNAHAFGASVVVVRITPHGQSEVELER